METVTSLPIELCPPPVRPKPVINRCAKLRPETKDEKGVSILNLLKLTGRAMSVYQLCEACEFSETAVRALIRELKIKNEVILDKGLVRLAGNWH